MADFDSGWGEDEKFPRMGVVRDRVAEEQAEAAEALVYADAGKAFDLFRGVDAWLRVVGDDLQKNRNRIPDNIQRHIAMRLQELENLLRSACGDASDALYRSGVVQTPQERLAESQLRGVLDLHPHLKITREGFRIEKTESHE